MHERIYEYYALLTAIWLRRQARHDWRYGSLLRKQGLTPIHNCIYQLAIRPSERA